MSQDKQTDRDDVTGGVSKQGPESPASEQAAEKPQVFALQRKGSSWQLSRRGFLAGGAAAGGALAAGCGGGKTAKDAEPVTPVVEPPMEPTDAHARPKNTCQAAAYKGSVTWMALSLDGRFLVTVGTDSGSGFKIWSIPDGALVRTVKTSTTGLLSLAISSDGRYVALARYSSTQIWDLSQRTPTARPLTGSGRSGVLAFVGRLDDLAVGASSGKITLFPARGGAKQTEFTVDKTASIARLQSDWMGKQIALVDNAKKTISVVAIPDGKPLFRLQTQGKATISALDLGRGHGITAAGHTGGDGSIWGRDGVFPKSTFKTGKGKVHAVRVTDDGQKVISVDASKSCRVFSTSDGKELSRFELTGVPTIRFAEITPDGKHVIVAYNGFISMFSVDGKKHEKCLMDLSVSSSTTKGIKYQGKNSYGHTVTYTLPCGSPIPAGAVCTCNCVPGSIRTTRRTYSTGRTYRTYRTYTIRYWYPN